jgi:hypothetical protein
MQENATSNAPTIFEEHMEYKQKTIGSQIYRKSIKNTKSMDESKT